MRDDLDDALRREKLYAALLSFALTGALAALAWLGYI